MLVQTISTLCHVQRCCLQGSAETERLAIVGGDPDGGTSAEVWSPKKLCQLPPLVQLVVTITVGEDLVWFPDWGGSGNLTREDQTKVSL